MIELIINDLQFDVDPETEFAQTINGINLANPTNPGSSTTNELKLPKSKRNLANIGLLHMVGSQSKFAYRRYTTKLSYDGIPLFNNGFSFLNDITDTINVVVCSEVIDLFSLIGNKELPDLAFSYYGNTSITWDAAAMDTNRKKVSNIYVAPFLQYGNIDETLAFEMPHYSPPSVWVEAIFKSILHEQGYSWDGPLFDSSVFQSMIIPYSKKEYPPSTATFLPYANNDFAGYTLPQVQDILPKIKQKDLIRDILTYFGLLFRVRNGVFETRAIKSVLSDFTNAMDWTLKRDASIEGFSFNLSGFGQTNSLKYKSNDDLFNADVDSAGAFTIDNELIDQKSPYFESIFNGSKIFNCTNTVPQTIQTIKIPVWDTPRKILFLNLAFGDYSNIGGFGGADSWSYDGSDWSIDASVSEHTNRLQFVEPDPDPDLYRSYPGGNYIFYVDWNNITLGTGCQFYLELLLNGTLVQTDVFSFNGSSSFKSVEFVADSEFDTARLSIANGTIGITNFEITVLQLLQLPDYAFDEEPGNRIAVTLDASSETVYYNGNNRSDYLVAQFNDLDLQDAADNYLLEMRAALQEYKKVRRYYRLSLMDISALDTWRLVYDDGHYFIISGIDEFIPGELTAVDLVKIL